MLWTCRKRFCLDLGETDPASSRWFGVPNESAALQFGRTDAPSTPPLRFQMLRFRTRRDPDTAPSGLGDHSTALGVFLRLTHIEALPMLINALRGDVSIIDPNRRSPSFLD